MKKHPIISSGRPGNAVRGRTARWLHEMAGKSGQVRDGSIVEMFPDLKCCENDVSDAALNA